MSNFNLPLSDVEASRRASVIPAGSDPPPRPAAELSSTPLDERRPRRSFTVDEKLKILAEVDAAPRGAQGAILRKYGVYSSHVVNWRQALHERGREGLRARKPGPTATPPAREPCDVARIKQLEKKLQLANELLTLQKSDRLARRGLSRDKRRRALMALLDTHPALVPRADDEPRRCRSARRCAQL